MTLYFSQEYEQLSRTSEMLVRTAIVKTMTQFGGIIDYVSFNVDGSWLTDSNGNTLRMKNSDYVSEVSGSQGHVKEARFCLYFCSKRRQWSGENLPDNSLSGDGIYGRSGRQNFNAGLSVR